MNNAIVDAVGLALKQWSKELNAEAVVVIHSQILPTAELLCSSGNLELKGVHTGFFKF